MIEYSIISTGSKGNAVVINNNLLIDYGVPFRALNGAYKGLQLVLLTHIHADHFHRRTVKNWHRNGQHCDGAAVSGWWGPCWNVA